MPENDFESLNVSLVSSRFKNCFKMNYACLESIQAYLVNSRLINSFEMKYGHLESVVFI